MLINLVYVSAATHLLTKEELVALMQKCSQRNADRKLPVCCSTRMATSCR
jgi:hypothetical protein